MGPKKLRSNVRKIDIHTDTPTEFDMRGTAADIQKNREERGQRKGPGRRQKTQKID